MSVNDTGTIVIVIAMFLLFIHLIQTRKGSNERLFILAWTHSMQILHFWTFLCLDLVLEC